MSRFMILAVCLAVLPPAATDCFAEPINEDERKYQDHIFKKYWDIHLERRLDRLPTEGSVPDFRVPYSGSDYPDVNGGTDVSVGSHGSSPLRKYDRAFNGNRLLATQHERHDVTRQRTSYYVPSGWRGMSRRLVTNQPGWHGHCNGRTAASIRHAEPRKSVVRNGVTFTPADIKALLADTYMYSETEHLGGVDYVINPGTFHVTLANWLGRGEHPVGMEATPGEVVYNYPIYAYRATTHRHSERQVEVQLNATYAVSVRYESDRSPRVNKAKFFHYLLNLDENGKILGGQYYSDSSRIDMLWAPLKPAQSGEEGNEMGNPYVDVKTVMTMWRESVPQELRDKWLNIDPLSADAKLSEDAQPTKLWGGWKPPKSD